MQRNVALGIQNFSKLRENNYFYIDKTRFIKELWERGDDITLITRPRRLGKTLMLDMVKKFFSPEYSGRCDLFEELSIWNEKKYRELQGTIPVIFLSFANIKELSFSAVKYNICSLLTRLYSQYSFIVSSKILNKNETRQFNSVSRDMFLEKAKESLSCLAEYITHYYNKMPIILIDEYDTPMQEAWIHRYWEDIANFFMDFSTLPLKQILG